MVNNRTTEIVENLQLSPHPEGGYYREIYKSDEWVNKESLPERYSDKRSFSTSIYFFLGRNDISRLHRIKSDETWHYYEGAGLELISLDPAGNLEKIRLGMDLSSGERPQATIGKGCWFGGRSLGAYTLMGCTVAPGFEFDDFELAEKEKMLHAFPQHAEVINQYT